MTTHILDLVNIERKLFWTLVSFLGMFLGFYLYSMVSLTVNVVERDHAVGQVHTLTTEVGDLEGQYLARQNAITLAKAQALGLKEVAVKFAGVDTNAKLSMAR